MLDDGIAVDQGAVGAADVLEKRVGKDRDYGGVLTADGEIRQADLVVRATPDGDPLPIERNVHRRAIGKKEYELCHGRHSHRDEDSNLTVGRVLGPACPNARKMDSRWSLPPNA